MKKPLSKKVKVLIATLVVAVLLGACFAAVAVYVKREINKPKFVLPAAPEPVVTPLPDAADGPAFVSAAYDAAFQSGGDVSMTTSLDVPDESIVGTNDAVVWLKNNILGRMQGQYPSFSRVDGAEAEKAAVDFTVSGKDMEARQGTAEGGDLDKYYFSWSVAGLSETYYFTEKDEAAKAWLLAELKDVAQISDETVALTDVTYRADVNRLNDRLTKLEIARTYHVRATMTPVGKYAPLGVRTVEFDYRATDCFNFVTYGVRFTTHAVALSPKESHTLPVELVLPDDLPKEDFTLNFEVTQGEGDVDGTGVFTAHVEASEIPDVVTVTLTYDGKTYTDTLDIYVTELEVKSE